MDQTAAGFQMQRNYKSMSTQILYDESEQAHNVQENLDLTKLARDRLKASRGHRDLGERGDDI